MTQAVTVRRDGDAFQARIFWMKAATLLDEARGPLAVGFESGPKGFDDVWVQYDPRRLPSDHAGNPLAIERHQCKWHVALGTYTHVDLTRPEYIHASSVSLLQRGLDVYRQDIARSAHSRVKLLTNHRVDPADVLHGLIRTRSNVLDLKKLFDGTTARSASGKMRKLWCEHLGVDEDELRRLCAVLAFSHVAESLEDLRERLDDRLRAYGLRPSDRQASANLYDDLVFQWAAQGRLEFDRASFRDACQREGLFEGKPARRVTYGVKSFEHAFDRLEDRCTEVLNLVPEFDERFIRDTASWDVQLYPAIASFLKHAAQSEDSRLRLALDSHTTLAYAAGSVLHTKSGRVVEIEQRSPDRKIWAPDDGPVEEDWPAWQFSVQPVAAGCGHDLAVAVSLARDVSPKVLEYVQASVPSVTAMLVATLPRGASQSAVLGGAHAHWLAEQLATRIRAERAQAAGAVHLFIAAPNAFTFYLGRHASLLRPVVLYEFDFEGQRGGSYAASLRFD